MIEALGADAGRVHRADWTELYLMFTDLRSITDMHTIRQTAPLDEQEHVIDRDDGEPLEEEILESGAEKLRDDLWQELALRQEVLREYYPFELTAAGAGWRLRRRAGGTIRQRRARWVYKAALVMSAFRYGFITAGSGNADHWEALKKDIPDLLQAVAVFAAANLLDEVYWFGWPRPDHTAFPTAIKNLRNRLGLGVLRDPPTTTTPQAKDATVDLIAWRRFSDQMYGALILYGQVASGKRWAEKSTLHHIKGKFFEHFTDRPSELFLTSTFIPFVAHERVIFAGPAHPHKLRTDKARELDRDHGVVVDRLRLAELIGEGLRDQAKIHNCPDPDAVLVNLVRWLRGCRALCEPAA